MKHDFWYSKKQKDCINNNLPLTEHFDKFVHGMEYTEYFESGKGHSHLWDDGIFIGTFDLNEIVIKGILIK